jgi:hypothetical protein
MPVSESSTERKTPVVEHRSLKLHHFQDFRQHVHISLPQSVGKPFRTLEQAIIRQLRRGQESRTHYQQMILGVYATLGVFLLIASRNPLAHLSLIRFTVWSSAVHAAIMAAQALTNPDQVGHL